MNMGAKILLGLLLAWVSPAILADGYFTGTSSTPYPPGCATLPSRQEALYGDNIAHFWSGSLWLEVVQKVQSPDPFKNLNLVDVDMFRVGCAEPNRSVILVEFRLRPEWVDPRYSQIVLPTFGGDGTAMHLVPFDLAAEPNGWGQSPQLHALTKRTIGDYTGGWDEPRRFSWRYVLDIGPVGASWDPEFLANYYNESFPLGFHRSDGWTGVHVDVPATRDVLTRNPALPLNGRLSGTWVEQGAVDQGFLLSFSNPVPPAGSAGTEPENSELLVFLSWYTFDAQGGMLWLTGVARFAQGATEVSIPIVRVTRGQFLENRAADRAVVGEVRLKARQCNELQLDYDLADLGLGAGNLRLQRLHALEIAGYPCRDYAARLASLSPGQTD